MSTEAAPPPVTPTDEQQKKPEEPRRASTIHSESYMKKLNLVFRSMKRSRDFFAADYQAYPEVNEKGDELMKGIKKRNEYRHVLNHVDEARRKKEDEIMKVPTASGIIADVVRQGEVLAITGGEAGQAKKSASGGQLISTLPVGSQPRAEDNTTRALLPSKAPVMIKPKWHAPWKLYRVISGHTGWVRSVDVEPENQWFASGGADRIIKIWDLASGKLRLSLTGHISSVRAVKISHRNPYLFSGGEDKQVKCWDLEYNKVVRHYHGHLSAVQALAVHPTLDVLISTARDSTARVWDIRTKCQIHCLSGHTNTVADVVCQATNPQVITGSHDSTVRLWDLAAGKTMCTLTHHKKSIRSVVIHPTLNMFASGSPDNIKQWKSRNGEFLQNLSGHNCIINTMAVNEDGVLVSAGDNGSMCFWDWRSGFCFQRDQAKAQPGSIDSEAGIFSMTFDRTGLRLITAEADKTIKMYKEDDTATEESHPIVWRPEIVKRKAY